MQNKPTNHAFQREPINENLSTRTYQREPINENHMLKHVARL